MDPGSKRQSSKRVDYYGTFLEAVKEPQGAVQQEPVQQEPVQQEPLRREVPQRDASLGPGTVPVQEEGAPDEEVVDPIAMLKVLRDAGGTQDMSQLQAATNLRFSSFAEVVSKLEEAGLLKIGGTPGSEKVELMPAGATLAELG